MSSSNRNLDPDQFFLSSSLEQDEAALTAFTDQFFNDDPTVFDYESKLDQPITRATPVALTPPLSPILDPASTNNSTNNSNLSVTSGSPTVKKSKTDLSQLLLQDFHDAVLAAATPSILIQNLHIGVERLNFIFTNLKTSFQELKSWSRQEAILFYGDKYFIPVNDLHSSTATLTQDSVATALDFFGSATLAAKNLNVSRYQLVTQATKMGLPIPKVNNNKRKRTEAEKNASNDNVNSNNEDATSDVSTDFSSDNSTFNSTNTNSTSKIQKKLLTLPTGHWPQLQAESLAQLSPPEEFANSNFLLLHSNSLNNNSQTADNSSTLEENNLKKHCRK